MGFVLVLSVLGGVHTSGEARLFPMLELSTSEPTLAPLRLPDVHDWPVETAGSKKATAADGPGHSGWNFAGVIGGVPAGACILGLSGLAFVPSPEAGFYVGLGIGALLGGIGGYFLGELARNGSLGAKIGIVILDGLALPLLGIDIIGGLAPAIAVGGG
jgi:hypothetical protein